MTKTGGKRMFNGKYFNNILVDEIQYKWMVEKTNGSRAQLRIVFIHESHSTIWHFIKVNFKNM